MSDVIKQYKFYCPTCQSESSVVESNGYGVLGRAFGTITDPQKPNYCSHENAELEVRELSGVGEWATLTSSDAPRANPGR